MNFSNELTFIAIDSPTAPLILNKDVTIQKTSLQSLVVRTLGNLDPTIKYVVSLAKKSSSFFNTKSPITYNVFWNISRVNKQWVIFAI